MIRTWPGQVDESIEQRASLLAALKVLWPKRLVAVENSKFQPTLPWTHEQSFPTIHRRQSSLDYEHAPQQITHTHTQGSMLQALATIQTFRHAVSISIYINSIYNWY